MSPLAFCLPFDTILDLNQKAEKWLSPLLEEWQTSVHKVCCWAWKSHEKVRDPKVNVSVSCLPSLSIVI